MHKPKRLAIAIVRRLLRSFVPLMRFLPFGPPAARSGIPISSTRRILLLHPAHIGDIVIATSILAPLRRQFPGVRFGFVVGSGSAHVLEGIPDIEAIHRLDHWRLQRGQCSLLAKWWRYIRSSTAALRGIRARHYDVAICLFNENPDLLDIAWKARIPVRIGFAHSYFAPLATHSVQDQPDAGMHQAQRQAQVLCAFGIVSEQDETLRSELASDSAAALEEAGAVVPSGQSYRVIHMGTGFEVKEMPESFWCEVARALSTHCLLVFTGRGARELRMAAAVTAGLSNCIIAVDRLSWSGFVAVLRRAEMLYGVDGMAGHVAAAVGTPSVSAFSGLNSIVRWRPYSVLSMAVTHPQPCAPCQLPQGCPAMPCKDIDPAAFLQIEQVCLPLA